MNIYIPQHLKKLGIIKDMCLMISKYASDYEDPVGSFDSYKYMMKLDPVLRFTGYCIPKRDDQDKTEYESIINYITRLFYSLCGTTQIFSYMSRYLGLKFEGDAVYTGKIISFTLSESPGEDVALFDKYLREFLDTLLYYESLQIGIKNLGILISENLDFYTGLGVVTYKYFNDFSTV